MSRVIARWSVLMMGADLVAQVEPFTRVMYAVAPGMAGFTSLVNVTGGAAMSVPAGVDPDGLPLGAHFFIDLGGEPLLLSLAGQLERVAPWPRHAPLAG
ncbi:hypothetical protein [Nocardioides sp. YR527]|uniref:hypothetical protein n=1 Tax=Nocardioides sp. YR527 TaxID=1881028 RepID=UPI00115FC9F6|nr:hypothetical protein [Nocardioides sp. YR527]